MLTPILDVQQVREWDQWTIKNEPISSYHLMERAASRIAQFITFNFSEDQPIFILAGSGNNGGDGVAVARLLAEKNFHVTLMVVPFSTWSPETQKNIQKLPHRVNEVEKLEDFNFQKNTLVIDALFGSGLSRKLEGDFAAIVSEINGKQGVKIAIDTPSGLFGDKCNPHDIIFNADYTLTLEVPKKSMAESRSLMFTGKIMVLPIGLHPDYIGGLSKSQKHWFLKHDIEINKRKLFGHKGDFGSVSVIGGSKRTPGAPILAAQSAMVSGAGLVSIGLPKKFLKQMGVQHPEIMQLEVKGDEQVEDVKIHPKSNVVLIGPGLGVNKMSAKLIRELFQSLNVQFVLDADALNTIAKYKIDPPKEAVLTPHIMEMHRLLEVDKCTEEELHVKARKYAVKHQITLVLKNANTLVVSPEGDLFQHIGGNDALAKGGSGDVLAGVISGLLAQKDDAVWACNTAIEIQQHAAHLFCKTNASHAMTPNKLIELIGASIKDLS